MPEPAAPAGLYLVTPERLSGIPLLAAVDEALAAGARWLQYRDKTGDAVTHRATSFALAMLCRQYGAQLVINDDLELALAIDGAGLHLGRDDGDLAAARARLGPERVLGASCYGDLQRARDALAAGASYVAFGAMYPSASKPQAPAIGSAVLAEARAAGIGPRVAIGGITLERAADTLSAGADALAVIGDVFDAPDIRQRVRGWRALLDSFPDLPHKHTP
ncbi:MAG: thiamine phosphate synthase [Rhodocyclaceae bacterium]|nr:thiamine phosphate synthase [Rhodocyclaceae bacterium]